MVPVSEMSVCLVVDVYGGITAFAYDKLCFNLLKCWAIPSSQVEFCGIQKQFLLLPSKMDWKVAPFWWFSVGFFNLRRCGCMRRVSNNTWMYCFCFLVVFLEFVWSFWFGYLRVHLCFCISRGCSVVIQVR